MPTVAIREAEVDDTEAIASLICALTERFIAGNCSPQDREALLKSMLPRAIKGYLETGYRYRVADIEQAITLQG